MHAGWCKRHRTAVVSCASFYKFKWTARAKLDKLWCFYSRLVTRQNMALIACFTNVLLEILIYSSLYFYRYSGFAELSQRLLDRSALDKSPGFSILMWHLRHPCDMRGDRKCMPSSALFPGSVLCRRWRRHSPRECDRGVEFLLRPAADSSRACGLYVPGYVSIPCAWAD